MNALGDRDIRDALFGIPESEIQARMDEDIRVEETNAFVDYLKAEVRTPMGGGIRGLSWIAMCAYTALDFLEHPARRRPSCYQDKYEEFADRYGWPAVFGALSRAMREIEHERERLLTQG